MPRAGELDWTDFMKGDVGEPEDVRSRPLDARQPIKNMKKVAMPPDTEIRKAILDGAPRQPTDEELFGHLVVSEEKLKKADAEWHSSINNWYKTARTPVDDQSAAEHQQWGTRKSIFEDMDEEEKKARAMHVDE